MHSIGDTLQLLHDAPRKTRTLSAVVHVLENLELSSEAWARYAGYRPAGAARPIEGPTTSLEGASHRRIFRVWWREHRWRVEYDLPGDAGVVVHIVNGRFWWHSHPQAGTFSNASTEDARPGGVDLGLLTLLNPTVLLPWIRLISAEACTTLGREAVTVSAIPRTPDADLQGVLAPPPPADGSTLIVDAESGIILSMTDYLEGQIYRKIECSVLRLNLELGADLFAVDEAVGPESPPPPPPRPGPV